MKSLSTSNFINILGVFNFALLLALSASFLIANPNSSNAETVTASAGSSAYSASISTNDAVTIPITPTASQAEYVTEVDDSKVIFSSTCPTGATVTLSTDSSDNALTRTGSDTGVKTINATTGDGLSDNTWGYKIQGSAFSGVPVSSSPVVLHNSTGVETNTDIKVIYGVKTDNNLPSGVYTNNVVYTVAVQPSCLKYSLSFDLDGGTGASGVDYSTQSINYGEKINLSTYTPTKAGYVFAGWTNGSSSFSGSETSVDVNPNNSMELTLKAEWVVNILWLYNEGDEYTNVTGGWTNDVYYSISQCQSYNVYCNVKRCYKNTNNINCALGSVGVRTSNVLITTNRLDLSPYTKIYISASSVVYSSYADNFIAVTNAENKTVHDPSSEYIFGYVRQNGTSSFDINSLTNNTTYRIAIGNSSGSQSGNASFIISKIWLE